MATAPTRLVLLPGWAETGGVFARLLPRLPATVAAEVVELADPTITDWSVRALAARVADPQDRSRPTAARTVVLGTSSGGYVAQQLAVDRPDLLDGLVLVGSPVDLRSRPPFADDVERLTDPVDPAWVLESLAWFGTGSTIPADFLAARAAESAALGARVWRDSLHGLVDSEPPLSTGRIEVPTLVVGGAQDELVGPSHERLLAALPRARGTVYARTGHLVLWERPDRVAADVVDFLDDVGRDA
ncbi:alpha/beta hydrolase [Isoptericola haloaureus]|uniref:Alpha/beta hydrolase n=1 Tax=Isoptericola haloaureus TaxID=1542902 RepID=A0ABU7Z2X9_9MICO